MIYKQAVVTNMYRKMVSEQTKILLAEGSQKLAGANAQIIE